MPRVLIMEPHLSGHRGPYLQWFASQYSKLVSAVRIATFSSNADRISIKETSNVSIWLDPDGRDRQEFGREGLVVRQNRYWRLFSRWYQGNTDWKPDFVFLPNVDYCMYAIGVRGSPFGETVWAGLGMKETFHFDEAGVVAPPPKLARVRRLLFQRALNCRTLRAYLCTDELLVNHFGSDRVRFFPELGVPMLSLDRESARRLLGLNPDRHVVLVYGSLTERKGIRQLLQGIERSNCRNRLQLLIAGNQSSQIRALLADARSKEICSETEAVIIDRVISRKEEEAVFTAVDSVWLGYSRHYGSSGVLVQAGTSGRPIIACREGIIGWKAAHYGLGPIVDPNDPEQIARAIDHLVSNRAAVEVYGKNAARAFSEYSNEGSARALRGALGI